MTIKKKIDTLIAFAEEQKMTLEIALNRQRRAELAKEVCGDEQGLEVEIQKYRGLAIQNIGDLSTDMKVTLTPIVDVENTEQ